MGWQIGNEYTDESYGPDARTAWVAWLKQRYGTLDKLNDAWTTNYWSQTYTAWDQVPFNTEKGNHGLMPEQKCFITSQRSEERRVGKEGSRRGDLGGTG